MQLRWLHISDLHAGQDTQNWLWPGLQTTFFDDLDRLIPAMGGLDLVIFSGDLTQRGSQGDFDTLKRMLERIWAKFEELHCKPQLFMVPGNHDLVRPDESDPITVAMQAWWGNNTVKDAFWKSPTNPYLQFVEAAFAGYSKFRSDLLSAGFPLCPITEGVLPGDCSHVFIKDGLRVGLVGLNSTFLQLSNVEDPKLDLDVRQLLAVTGNEPDGWCRANHANLLITHHPSSWLAEAAVQHLNAEIYPPARFTAHLFGHMHVPDVEARSKGGSADRKLIQAASLYGLRKYANGKHDRIHGYSGARLEIGADSGRILMWPRIGATIAAGSRKFVPDNSFDLSEQNNFELCLGQIASRSSTSGLGGAPALPTSFGTAQQEAAFAATTRSPSLPNKPLQCSPQHLHVRRLEQGRLRVAIETHRVAWISADWGYAADEFVGSVVSALASPVSATYHIDLIDYRDRDSFLAKFATEAGCSFQEFCKSISGIDRVLLVLEDVPVYRPHRQGSESWANEIESIVDAIREYCPNSLTILTSRQVPSHTQIPILEIRPLDEPDVKAYIANHSLGGPERANPSDVADILRLTGGLPLEIDALLRELEFISLPELIELRLTAPRTESMPSGHDRLLPVIDGLRNAGDPDVARSFELLVALSAFPYGETLTRIKRFDSQRAFYPSQAAILSDRGLIESVANVPALKLKLATDQQSPKLVAKKVVRQAVEAVVTPDALDKRDNRAATLYFGDRWILGEPKTIRTADLIQALGGDGGLGNPHAVINSLLQRSVEVQDTGRIKRVVQLARLFIANLGASDSYRSSVTACQDFLKLIPATKEYQGDINYFRWNLARCLRMLGRTEQALEIFEKLEIDKFERMTQQRILLNWALAAQHTNPLKSKDLAQQVVTLGKRTLSGLHAQALVLELSPEIEDRFDQLQALEKRARSKKATIVANNIAFFLATTGNKSFEEKRSRLQAIAASAKLNGDAYSAARAIVELSMLVAGQKGSLAQNERSGLIEAYHYLYNERISSLFRRCHEGLWRHFVESDDVENLLRLFRHSSFIWRIYGNEVSETPYIEQLLGILSNSTNKPFASDSAEGAYLLTRAERLKLQSS